MIIFVNLSVAPGASFAPSLAMRARFLGALTRLALGIAVVSCGDAGPGSGAPDAAIDSQSGADDSVEPPGDGTGEPATLSGWLNVQTAGDPHPDSFSESRPGTTVRVLDADPPVEAVVDSEGMWAVEIPFGVHMLHADAPEHWGAVLGTVFDYRNQGTNRRLKLYTDGFVEDVATRAGRPIDADRGMVAVFMGGARQEGGESASIGAEHDGTVVFRRASGAYDPVEQHTLEHDSPDVILFTNVVPGWTTVEVRPSGDLNTCELEHPAEEISEWRVVAKSTTMINVQCRSL